MNESQPTLSPELLLTQTDFVRALARSLLADPHAADDVAQDTLVAALERPPRAAGGLRAWLSSVARNGALQLARSESRRRGREAGVARSERIPSAADVSERESLRAAVVRAVLALPDPSRTAVLLRFYEGRAPREIAALLAIPVETVRSRIKRGLERLREELAATIGADQADWRRALLPLAGPGLVHAGAALTWSTLWASTSVKVGAVAAGVAALATASWFVARGGSSAPGSSSPVAQLEPSSAEPRAEGAAALASASPERQVVAAE